MSYNPHHPDTIGPEWFPTIKAAKVLNGPVSAGAQSFVASATEDVTGIAVFLPALSTLDDASGWEIEVYEVDNPGLQATTVDTFLPASVVHIVNAFWYNSVDAPAGSAPNTLAWKAINNYPEPLYFGKGIWPNTGDPTLNNRYLFNLFGTGYDAAFGFSDVAGSVGSKRITKVTLKALAAELIAYYMVSAMGATPYLWMDGVRYVGGKVTIAGQTPAGALIEASWTANPASGCSWKGSDVDNFDSVSGAWGAGWLVDPTNSSNNLAQILQGWMEIETTTDVTDPRKALGCLTSPVYGWNVIPVEDPTGGPWVKTSGTEYVVVFRRRHGNRQLAWRYLAATDLPFGTTNAREAQFAVGSNIFVGLGADPLPGLYAMGFQVAGGTSVDGTPYASVNGDYEPALSVDGPDWPTVDSAHVLRQEFTTVGSDEFGWVRFLAKAESDTVDGDLTVIVEDSGSAQQGAALVFTAADLVRPVTKWRVLEGKVSGSTLDATTQYLLKFSTTASPDTAWNVQVLSCFLESQGAPADIGDGTAGGETDAGGLNGTRHVEIDVAATIATQPDAPAGFAAALVDAIECWDDVDLSWTPTSISAGGGFRCYEIERSDDGATDWQQIAYITTESVDAFLDCEARLNRTSSYRIRVRREDWSASDWSATITASPLIECCGYTFTSNTDPTLNLYGEDFGADRPTEQLDRGTFVTFHNRDYQIGFFGLEYSGQRFTRDLLLAADGGITPVAAPTEPGMRTFARVLALLPALGAGLPYICVRNADGDRWFAAVTVTRLDVENVGAAHIATVEVVEVTDTPSAPDVEVS